MAENTYRNEYYCYKELTDLSDVYLGENGEYSYSMWPPQPRYAASFPLPNARVVTVAQPLVFTAVALTIFVQRTEITTSPTISSTSSSCCWSRCYRYYALISKATNDKYDKREKWGRKREKWGKWEREGERAGGRKRGRERELIWNLIQLIKKRARELSSI